MVLNRNVIAIFVGNECNFLFLLLFFFFRIVAAAIFAVKFHTSQDNAPLLFYYRYSTITLTETLPVSGQNKNKKKSHGRYWKSLANKIYGKFSLLRLDHKLEKGRIILDGRCIVKSRIQNTFSPRYQR